jgi:hypothetical protein
VVIQLIRCSPQPQGQELAPAADLITDSAIAVLTDGWTVLSTAQCTLSDLKDDDTIVDYFVGAQTFVGPDGAIVGSELQVTIAVDQT